MKKIDLPYLAYKKIRGQERCFYRLTWQEGGKRREKYIEIKAAPDTPEFAAEYWSIRSGKSAALPNKKVKTSWRALITSYRASSKYKRLAPSTKRPYDLVIEQILEKNADKDVRDMTRAAVRAIHEKYADTPRKADWYVQVISLLLNFAKRHLDWPIDNVAEGIELHGKRREFEPWPEWMIERLADAPATVRTAAELILGTGQRPSAAITMRRTDFAGEWMTVTDEKRNERFEVFCPHPLRAYVSGLPITGEHILAKTLRTPLGYSAVEKSFRAWRAELGDAAKPFSLHGLRKLAIVRLAEAGCTDAQIQAITNQTPEMVAYYRRRASRKTLSKAAHAGAERTKHEK